MSEEREAYTTSDGIRYEFDGPMVYRVDNEDIDNQPEEDECPCNGNDDLMIGLVGVLMDTVSDLALLIMRNYERRQDETEDVR